MSAKHMGMVFEHVLDPTDQQVLLALANHAQPDGSEVRPGINRIAWETGLSVRTVQRVVNGPKGRPELGLVGRGVLEMTRRPGFHQPAVYRLHLSRLVRKAPYVPGVHMGDTVTPIPATAMGDAGAEKGDRTAARGDTAVSPKPRTSEASSETRAEKNIRSGRFDTLCAIAGCTGRGRGNYDLCVDHLGLGRKLA